MPLSILWVDDQSAGITRLADVLRMYGHTISIRSDATQALADLTLKHETYDVVIIDVMLPPGQRKDLFPNGVTDDGLSTGALLIDYLIEGKKGENEPLRGIGKKLIILSGASMERITQKIQLRVRKYEIPYKQKGIYNDVVEFAQFVEEFAAKRTGGGAG